MNLFWFLTSVIQYNLSWNKRASIQQMKQMLEESGAVWQKFAQTLAGQEDIIGKDLANELSSLLFDCPAHSDEYSRDVIQRMFGDKYCLTEMKLIGSGTIAQVYRVGDVCIKVRHPNVVREVMDAVANYDSVKNMFFMPVMLKSICDNFFEGLVEQLDFHREFNNGNTLKHLIHGDTDGTNNLYIITRMLDTSDECLVMKYEPSQSIAGDEHKTIDKHVLLRFLHGVGIFSYISQLHGFIHADLHMGNYGIRNPETPDSMRIVMYDFGHMYDVRDLSYETRYQILLTNTTYHTEQFIRLVLSNEPEHIDKLLYLCSNHNDISNPIHFVKNANIFIQYITLNGIQLNRSIFRIIVHMEKILSVINITKDIEKQPEYKYMYNDLRKYPNSYYYDKYYPYDDVKILKDKLGHIIIPS
jgi:predicted unusual protein kinase regulating ubiquinone biosynthesis (AarF/ABC1/UbiB family)